MHAERIARRPRGVEGEKRARPAVLPGYMDQSPEHASRKGQRAPNRDPGTSQFVVRSNRSYPVEQETP